MKLYNSIDDFAKQASLLDIGLLHLCVGSAGLIAGLLAPKKEKKSALATASVLFSLSLIPLMFKFVRTAAKHDRMA